jgi:ribose transport system substrate-binding protein
MLTTFDRRLRLITLLQEQPGIRVPELARNLDVSEGTIRNDFRALAESGQLTRVRGGAVLIEDFISHSPTFAARAKENTAAKQRLAGWAADLVEDGDAILLDASTTVFNLANHIKDLHNLTVITNGIDVGRELAQNTSNTVILVGGVLRSDGTSITGLISEEFLKDLHIKTAFVSCSSISLEAGLTEIDIHEAHIKQKMIASANAVVALIDSSKFGKADLTSFARIQQVSHLYTDVPLGAEWLKRLHEAGVTVTVCGEEGCSTFSPHGPAARHYKIGFANLNEHDPFPMDVRRGVERAAREAGNIDLVLADNQLNGEIAMQVADRLIQEGVDLMIEYQIDEQVGNRIMERFRTKGIPVIAVDIPMLGATFFGVDNYRAGYMAGEALGRWVSYRWGGEFDLLLILDEPRAGALPAARIQGQLDGMQSIIGNIPEEKKQRMNSGNTSEISQSQVRDALLQWPLPNRIAVISFNDDAAIGAQQAARELKRESDVVIVGQGADRRVREELLKPDTCIIGSTAYEPERYGEKLIPLALKIIIGEPVPPAVYVDHAFIPSAITGSPSEWPAENTHAEPADAAAALR